MRNIKYAIFSYIWKKSLSNSLSSDISTNSVHLNREFGVVNFICSSCILDYDFVCTFHSVLSQMDLFIRDHFFPSTFSGQTTLTCSPDQSTWRVLINQAWLWLYTIFWIPSTCFHLFKFFHLRFIFVVQYIKLSNTSFLLLLVRHDTEIL